MPLPRTGTDWNLCAPSGNLQLLYIIGNQKGTHQWLMQACYADSGLHPTFCKAGCLQPKYYFLVYLSPNSHVDLRDSNNLVWGKENQVSSVSKQCTGPNSCFPNKEGLASNKFRPLKLARNIWLASAQQPRLTLSLPGQMRWGWGNSLLKVAMWLSHRKVSQVSTKCCLTTFGFRGLYSAPTGAGYSKPIHSRAHWPKLRRSWHKPSLRTGW